MTEDVTRGLSLLADEADPAPINSHAVIALARARTSRRRAVVASASVTLAAVGVLALTVTALREPAGIADGAPTTTTTITVTESPSAGETEPGGQQGPVMGTRVRQPATAEERAERAARLQRELTAGFDRLLPDGWEYSTFEFACDQYGCWAQGDIVDETGPLNLSVHVSGDYDIEGCLGACTKTVLDDNTLVALNSELPGGGLSLDSVRPDGTAFGIYARWPAARDNPLTDDQWRAFGNVVTY